MTNLELIRAGQVAPASRPMPTEPRIASPFRRSRPPAKKPGDLQRAKTILLKQWRSASAFTVVVVIAVAVTTFLMHPVYEPEGRLQIDPPGAELFSLEGNSGEITDADYISTEAAKLQTHELELETVRSLQLDRNPEFSGKAAHPAQAPVIDGMSPAERIALHSFSANLTVNRTPSSRLVAVRFASHDPQLAANVVNTLMRLFVERNYQVRHDEIVHASSWLARQLDDVREKMENALRQLADFQQANGIADVADTTTIAQQVTDLNKQFSDAQAERIQLESYLNHLNNGDSLPQVNSNPVMQTLREKRAEVEAELAQTRVIYGPNHANVRKLENQAAELDRQMADVRANQAAALQTSYAAAQAREQLLQTELKTATERLNHLEKYTDLKKEAAADRDLYDKLYAKIKEAGIAAASKSGNIRIVESAPVLDRPTRPHRAFNLIAGVLLGLFGGITLAFVKEGIEDRVHTADDIREAIGPAPVAVIPSMRRFLLHSHSSSAGRFSRVVPSRALIDRPHSPESEAIGVLRTSLFLQRSLPTTARVLLVTSPLPGEGKTTVAANLAAAIAKHHKVCLVDCDMRRPSAASAFRIPPSKALQHLLRGQVSLAEVLYPVPGVENLSLLASWTPVEDASELITLENISALLNDLRERFEYIVIDTPPVLPYSEGRLLATAAEGIILVTRSASTPRSAIRRTIEVLSELRCAPILSVVLNGADFSCADNRYCYGYR